MSYTLKLHLNVLIKSETWRREDRHPQEFAWITRCRITRRTLKQNHIPLKIVTVSRYARMPTSLKQLETSIKDVGRLLFWQSRLPRKNEIYAYVRFLSREKKKKISYGARSGECGWCDKTVTCCFVSFSWTNTERCCPVATANFFVRQSSGHLRRTVSRK